ncbi:endonuclease/exonuclease/phosphatase family protein [Rhizobium tumorigenes]|uniref:Endonuclease/exonuclease/phosphatase family protein n=1 Tax=Rhizobium tumorigenes TaxID=2041385 RepID=A0AAF1K2Z9_9HYPH|nr:endonuclease/exonuclease/phosphatase family protein [Rhizobium tumorigenes]WFR94204.1 endonuclease/exonuclease/phosphatase family protein [Rhizobium tumorigenes]
MRDTVYCVISVVTTCILGILAARYVTHLWILAFFESLQTHIGIACIVGALLALAVRRHWYAIAMLVVAIVITGHSIVLLQARAETPAPADAQPSYRLLSFNIDGDNFSNSEKIADLVLNSKADVVEMFEAPPMLSQMTRLAAVYPYRIGCGVMEDNCDSLLMSKRPFISQSIGSLSGLWRNRFILATVDIDGQKIAFASAHLSKPYFDDFHADELAALSDSLNAVREPLLLAGDFNAAVVEPDMQAFLRRSNLAHVFPEPATWPIEAGALGIAIDHVFARPPLQLKSVRRIEDAMGSNHYGLITDFTIAR